MSARFRPIAKHTAASLAAMALAASVAVARAQSPDHAAHHAKPKASVTLSTDPTPPVPGEATFTVTVRDEQGQPVMGADVVVVLVMPMPGLGDMRTKVTLEPTKDPKQAAEGVYAGKGQIFMAGTWNATITIQKDGQAFEDEALELVAR